MSQIRKKNFIGQFLYIRIIGKQDTRPRAGHLSIYYKAARTLNLIYLHFSTLFRTFPYHLIRSAFCLEGKNTGGRLIGLPNLSKSEFSPTSTSTPTERTMPASGTPGSSQVNNRQTKERLEEAVVQRLRLIKRATLKNQQL